MASEQRTSGDCRQRLSVASDRKLLANGKRLQGEVLLFQRTGAALRCICAMPPHPNRPKRRRGTVMIRKSPASRARSTAGFLRPMRAAFAGRGGSSTAPLLACIRPDASICATTSIPSGCLIFVMMGVSGGLTASRHTLRTLSMTFSASGRPTTRPRSSTPDQYPAARCIGKHDQAFDDACRCTSP